ncbi:MAG: 50S ribosomal protein L11 methyltransferase [Anaerolineales bacterium]|nr:50S ribosomal protein L11 methyltransferase [Anaerolineales bacterium]
MREPSWLEVSLTVDGELAEAVADVLARFAPNGVVTEQGVGFINDEDEGTPVGEVTVRAYLPADANLDETRQKLEQALYFLGTIRPLPAATLTPVADQNWMEAWKSRYRPIPVGERLIIVPAWLESPDASRIPIRIDPGMAFGTGTHPTTQLCMVLIEQCYVDRGPSSVIDIGCGSGILSIAALKLGAEQALGVDIDGAAVTASGENGRANSILDERFMLGVGSVAEVLAGQFPLRQAPLVVANILAPVLVRLFEAGMADLITPGGTILLSGILQEQAATVIGAAQEQGLDLVDQKQMGDWVALAMRREASASG